MSFDLGSSARFRLSAVLICAAIVSAVVVLTPMAAGASFGQRGKKVLSFEASAEKAIAAGRSRTLLVGRFGEAGAGLVRLRANGSLDRSFGSNGFVYTPAVDAVVQADGKIVVISESHGPSSSGPTMTRLLPNGHPDPAFGAAGEKTVRLPIQAPIGTAIAPLDGGRIIFAATSQTGEGRSSGASGPAVIGRLESNGKLDRTFSDDGFLELPGVLPIVDIDSAPRGAVIADAEARVGGLELYKLTWSGVLDPSLGQVQLPHLNPAPGGESFVPVPGIAVLQNGKILVAGTVSHAVAGSLDYEVMVIRLLANGALDPTYGEGGYVKAGFSGPTFATSFVSRKEGGVIVAASAQVPAGSSKLAAIALRPDGTLDQRFGQGGKVKIGFDGWVNAEDLVLQQPNRLTLVGFMAASETARGSTVLAQVPLTRSGVR